MNKLMKCLTIATVWAAMLPVAQANDHPSYTTSKEESDKVLKVHFENAVAVAEVGMYVVPSVFNAGTKFQYRVDNKDWSDLSTTDLDRTDNQLSLHQTGKDFYFRYGTENADKLCLTHVAAVPEPATYALLLGGLGVLGWAVRRRQIRPDLAHPA